MSVRPADEADRARVRTLLRASGLPLEGLSDTLLWVAPDASGQVLGCVGLEVHGEAGLLRSLAVAPDARAGGLGSQLVRHIIAEARARQLASLSLLTESAPDYFSRFGFRPVQRGALSAALHASPELRGACPESAAALLLSF